MQSSSEVASDTGKQSMAPDPGNVLARSEAREEDADEGPDAPPHHLERGGGGFEERAKEREGGLRGFRESDSVQDVNSETTVGAGNTRCSP